MPLKKAKPTLVLKCADWDIFCRVYIFKIKSNKGNYTNVFLQRNKYNFLQSKRYSGSDKIPAKENTMNNFISNSGNHIQGKRKRNLENTPSKNTKENKRMKP